MDKDYGLVLRQDDVRFPGELAVLWSSNGEAVAEAMQHRANDQLGFGVRAADAGHHFAALLLREYVRHRIQGGISGSERQPILGFMRHRRIGRGLTPQEFVARLESGDSGG